MSKVNRKIGKKDEFEGFDDMGSYVEIIDVPFVGPIPTDRGVVDVRYLLDRLQKSPLKYRGIITGLSYMGRYFTHAIQVGQAKVLFDPDTMEAAVSVREVTGGFPPNESARRKSPTGRGRLSW